MVLRMLSFLPQEAFHLVLVFFLSCARAGGGPSAASGPSR